MKRKGGDIMFSILVVDDEDIVVAGIKKTIRLYKYPLTVYTASDGQEAKHILENKNIDILMTDIEIPFINGLDLIEIAAKINPAVKSIVFSAYSDFEYARRAISLQAIYYLLKPINMQEFRTVMEKVIAACKQEHVPTPVNTQTINDDELLFRDMFNNSGIGWEILKSVSFFADTDEGILFALIYLKFTSDKFKNIKISKALKINNIKCCEYIIDEHQHVLAFRYYRFDSFNSQKIYEELQEWIESSASGEKVFGICAENISEISVLYGEVEKIKKLRDFSFYSPDTHTFLQTNLAKSDFSIPVDVQNLLDIVSQDINDNNYWALKTDVSQLLELLILNKHLSPMYVKYLFFDIIKQLHAQLPQLSDSKVSKLLEVVANAKNVKEIKVHLDELVDKLVEQDETQYSHNKRIVDQLLDCIHHEYSSELSLEYLAKKVYLSPAYTSTIFKQITNQTVVSYINNYRMQKAKKLLANTNMKLADIYPLVGYSSLAYFCILFKNMFGMTPSQYRKEPNDGENK